MSGARSSTVDAPTVDEQPQGQGGTLLVAELMHVIRDAIADHPRSKQTRIGLSEVGHPCDRWMSYKLANIPAANPRPSSWLATIGTAVHIWLADTFERDTLPAVAAGQPPRWLVEQKVSAGVINDEEIDGSTDLFDTITNTVVDWKVVGKTRLDKYRRHGPDPNYEVQVHANGLGWRRKGYDVQTVAICFLPRNAELSDTVWWSQPYDEQVAVKALARAEVIAQMNVALGDATPGLMSTVDHNCGYCPWFQINAVDLTSACPGDPARPKSNDSIRSLIA